MKILKESLLLNDLSTTLDAVQEVVVMVKRNDKNPVILMSLEEYNRMQAEMYKNKK